MQNTLRLMKIKRQINELDDLILTSEKYKKVVAYTWWSSSQLEFKISRSKVKKLIPFDFIKFKGFDFFNRVFTADINKVRSLCHNTANNQMVNFIHEFSKLNLKSKLNFIRIYQETILLLIDIFKNYHQYEKTNDTCKIIYYLLSNLPDETNQVTKEELNFKKEVLNQRIAFELEFLNKLNGG